MNRSPTCAPFTGWKNKAEHLQYFAAKLAGATKHVFVVKGGVGKKQRHLTVEALASVPEDESRVILATGRYIGEGFDDARLDTLFPAMPISWREFRLFSGYERRARVRPCAKGFRVAAGGRGSLGGVPTSEGSSRF